MLRQPVMLLQPVPTVINHGLEQAGDRKDFKVAHPGFFLGRSGQIFP